MPSQYYVPPWNSTQSYHPYSIVDGLNVGAATHPTSSFLYATQANIDQYPSGIFNYAITSISCSEDIATVRYSQTGNVPNVAPGSIVMIAGTASYNYTGMALGGSSGYLSFINPGFDDSVGAAGTVSMRNPSWTSGFCFVPDYTSKISTQNTAIVTQLGNGYTQQMSAGVNTFEQTPNFVYRNIGKRQTKAITHFVQDAAGVYPFEVLMPDQYLNNQPKQKFFATMVDVTPASFGLYDVTVALRRSFNV